MTNSSDSGRSRTGNLHCTADNLPEASADSSAPTAEADRRATEDWEQTFNTIPDLVAILDDQHRIVRVNRPMAARLGVTPQQCVGLHCYEAIHGAAQPPDFCPHAQTCCDGREHISEVHEPRLGGYFLVSTTPRFDAQGRLIGAVHVARDITVRKRDENEREISAAFLRLVNESRGKQHLIRAAVNFFHEESGCEAVGIRLKVDDDYPYYETRGLPPEFVEAESRLCLRDRSGAVVRDGAGYPICQCMCGNVICGRFDASKPFFTARGNFWTNSTTELLATTTEAQRHARTRNRCNGEGYESVALIALAVGDDRLGLLQLNDRRKDRFTIEGIALWERLAGYLAVALAKILAEEALRESESRLRTMADAIPQLVWIAKGDGYVYWYNQRWYEYTGATPAQMEGWGWQSVHDPEVLPKVLEQWKASIATGQPFNMVFPLRGADGVFRPFLTRVVPLRDEQGRVQQWFGTNTDVADRKQAEEALRESEERMQMALEVSRSFAFDWDPGSDHVLRSGSCGRILGVSGDDLQHDTGQRYFQRIHGEDRERFLGILAALNPSADTYRIEYRLIRGDGGTVALEESARGFFDAAGKLRRLVGVTADVTERERQEQRMRLLSEVRAQLLASDQPQQIVESLCRTVMAHLECHAFFNYLVDEQSGHLHLNACAGLPEEAARQIEWLDFGAAVCGCVARDGCRIVAEHIQDTPDVRTDLVRSFGIQAYACHPLLNQGRVIGTLSFGSRTKPKFAEDELALMKAVTDHVAIAMDRVRFLASLEQRVAERTAEAERRAGQLRALAADMTLAEQRERRRLAQVLHDHLQQILVAAKMRVSLAGRKVEDPALAQSLRHISELLDQSIAESRSLTVELSPPVLYDRGLGGGLEWLARHFQERHQLQVFVDADAEAEPAEEASKVLLFQAAREMLFNTVKHAHAQAVQIRLTRRNGDCLHLLVSDDGQGFDASATNQGSTLGGFGLFSIRERLAVVGGSLEIVSAPGQGTQMVIELPLGRPSPPTATVKSGPPALGGRARPTAGRAASSRKIRVLLADDHAILRQGLAGLLQGHAGIELVGQARDGQQVVELALEIRPDVILMDITMPGLNGIEATRRITAELPEVCVIGLSMHEGEDMAKAMREAGAVAYLNKGEAADTLIATIIGQVAGRS